MNLLQTARELERYSLLAVDGEIGSAEDFFVDDTAWVVRYLVVNGGDWLRGGRVLVSTVAIGEIDEELGTINIELTRNQIGNSPPISADRPVSRQYEAAYYRYYNWTPYWKSAPFTGFPMSGTPMSPPPLPGEIVTPRAKETPLRSTAEFNGYSIAAQDGKIGCVDGLIIDTQYWVIRYLEIDTLNWWPGKHVLISPGWIEEVSWTERALSVDLARETIKRAPGYDPARVISRDYETQLFKYYRRPGYWRPGNQKCW